ADIARSTRGWTADGPGPSSRRSGGSNEEVATRRFYPTTPRDDKSVRGPGPSAAPASPAAARRPPFPPRRNLALRRAPSRSPGSPSDADRPPRGVDDRPGELPDGGLALALDHHAQQRLGAGVAYQHPPPIAQRALGIVDRGRDRRHGLDVGLAAHPQV